MKKLKDYRGVLITLIVISCLALWSCGGGGSGSGGVVQTNTALTSTNAPQAAGGLAQAISTAIPLVGMGEDVVVPFTASGMTRLQTPVRTLLSTSIAAAKNVQKKNSSYASGVLPAITESCTNGGNMTIRASWSGPANPVSTDDMLNLQANISFNSCREGTVTMNGSLSVAIDGAIDAPASVGLNANLSFSDTSNSTSLNLSSVSIVATHVAAGLDLSSATLELSGSISGTLEGETVDLMRCDNLTLVFSTVTGGITVSISGKIRSACLDTWLTITTATPITLLSGNGCPTAGDISAAYGGNTVRMVIAPDTSISLYFNGEPVGVYDNCVTLEGQCS